ncbi:MAG: biotin carboxylase N-terminal domain-containing protein [Chloroflexota bacterium]|jgi:acetyl-CoA carboxylase biotin carboxylase subunit|nr:biotin carboxylase N-terminal domain-containing protein [Chloroflexota bacterium]
MFDKLLIANRGAIAVRIIRTCREMGIVAVAVFDAGDRSSLHVRLADECVQLQTPGGYLDGDEILRIAKQTGAEAIHPGYGFLAERPEFIRACEEAGIAFVGPPSGVVAACQAKIDAMERVRTAGYRIPVHARTALDAAGALSDEEARYLLDQAQELGYPLAVKSCSGGRGRGTRVVEEAGALIESVRQARRETGNVYGDQRIYLERIIPGARHLEVQILGDSQGGIIHLGDRDGSLQRNNQKMVGEAPAPNLTPAQRAELWETALGIARLFDYRGAGTVEFLMDSQGALYFTEIKARIQVEHPVTEMATGVDIVREQIRIAAGLPLSLAQADVTMRGSAIQCRINAEDPWNHYLPSPGVLRRFRMPGGAHLRVDTYGCAGCEVPVEYDPILATVVVWGDDRDLAVRRTTRALDEFTIRGVQTNLTLLRQIVGDARFAGGVYDTSLLGQLDAVQPPSGRAERDLAAAAAVAYVLRNQAQAPVIPERTLSGWHRSSRALS